MKRASTWLGPGALPSALSRADFRSCMEYCWTCVQAPSGTRGTWRPRTAWKPGRSTGRFSYSSRQKAPNCEHHVVGLREERLGVGNPHVPEA